MIVKGDTDFVKCVNARQFQDLFAQLGKRTQNQEKIEFVQTCVRHKTGIGQPIDINFKAPLNVTSHENAKKEINYSWKSLGDETELLYQGKFKEYARIQCLKMCHYLKKVRNIEILQMQA